MLKYKTDLMCSTEDIKMSKKVYSIRNDVLYVDVQINNKRYRFSTRKKASLSNIDWLCKNINQVIAEHEEVKNRPNVYRRGKNYLYDFAMESFERNANSRREFTTMEYKAMFFKHIYPYFKNKVMEDIKPVDIAWWQSELVRQGLSAKRVRNIRIVLSFLYNEAIRLNLTCLTHNPCALAGKIPTGKQKKDKIKPFNLDEVKRILSKAYDEFRQMLTILFFTGLRTGELLALKWKDIDLEKRKLSIERNLRRGIITLTKTENSDRIIDLMEPVVNAFEILKAKYKKHDEFIFVNSKNELHYDGSVFSKKFKRVVRKAGITGNRLFYWTRHSFASIMIAEKMNINWIAKMMGHSSAAITLEKYSRYVENGNDDLDIFSKKLLVS
ncbi:TPA: site-specific integrase [Campylobacter jejuni]|nr:site-specific integrase [Campylobacter jejuni]HEC2492536.1 site-specific integrase [Campylobacter jejuni]